MVLVLDAGPVPLRSGHPVTWRLTLHNPLPEAVSLTFPTGQLGEIVLEQAGGERYRWSRNRVFIQLVTERRLEPGESWTIVLDDTLDVEPGSYEAVAFLSCRPSPAPVRSRVVVESVTSHGEAPMTN